MKHMLPWIIGIPKTILLNFYYLPFKKAIKFPFRVAGNFKIDSLGNRDAISIADGSKIIIGSKGSFNLGGGVLKDTGILGVMRKFLFMVTLLFLEEHNLL